MKVSVLQPVPPVRYDPRFTAYAPNTILSPSAANPDLKRIGHCLDQNSQNWTQAIRGGLDMIRTQLLDRGLMKFIGVAQKKELMDWVAAKVGLMGERRYRHTLKKNPESMDYLPENIRKVGRESRTFFVNQGWHGAQNTDNGVKLLMVLAFSRALQENNVQWPLAQHALHQMTQILNSPRLTQQLNTVDSLGKQLFENFSSGSEVTRAKPGEVVNSKTSRLQVEIVDDTKADIQILHSIPAKPASSGKSFNRVA